MKSTFLLKGDDSSGNEISGTCFLLKKSATINDSKENLLLITAHHVLKDIHDEYIVLDYPDFIENNYIKKKKSIRIRNNGLPLWESLQDSIVDVAAIKLNINDFRIERELTTEYLADENVLKFFNLNTGDNLFCIGFPEGISSNEFGFPILKSGIISSYPIVPSELYKYFLLDCEVFPASSGSPVYLRQSGRYYNDDLGQIYDSNIIQFICGIVVSKTFVDVRTDSTESDIDTNKISIQVAKVIPSTFIIEVINQID